MSRLSWMILFLFLTTLQLPLKGTNGHLTFSKGGLTLKPSSESNALEYTLEANGQVVLTGHLGLALPSVTGEATTSCDPGQADECYEWGDYARLLITTPNDQNDNCAQIEWISNFGRRLEDCFDLHVNVHWYGGAETRLQTWPIEGVSRQEVPHITGDFFQFSQTGSVVENYWLVSSGVALHVAEESPLFTSWNTVQVNKFCLAAQNKYPYSERKEVKLKYDLCVAKTGENFKDVHQRSIKKFYPVPTATPDDLMLVSPFWSTWAQYKENVNQSLVLEMAQKMIDEGYVQNSHLEIDDNWEGCRGDAEFHAQKFPDPLGMMKSLADLGINRTTIWIHPFINFECASFPFAFQSGYFVKDTRGRPGITWWWQSQQAGLIDFTNEEAVQWWTGRLKNLQEKYGITSFKFDAGEAYWLPASYQLDQPEPAFPNYFTKKYVETVSTFGNLVEARAAHQNQNVAMFIRMLDKDSRWDDNNGLRSLIPTLLLFSVLGYSYTMPDMIGGNAYGEPVSAELYIRWAQANIFMPAWQFSVLPWGIDESGALDRIVKDCVALRQKFGHKILAAARKTAEDGSPMNRPMWWVDPEDPVTYTISDQYMLGDDILVAPVVEEGAVTRNIYLPIGQWIDGNGQSGGEYAGPQWLQNWPAPIDTLPFFEKISK